MSEGDDPEAAGDAERLTLTAEELLGRAVLRLRLYRRWSQRDLERRSRVDQTTISRLETGHRSNLGAGRLCAILGSLGMADAQLLPEPDELERTTLELMLYGDPWERAGREADRRIVRRHQRAGHGRAGHGRAGHGGARCEKGSRISRRRSA